MATGARQPLQKQDLLCLPPVLHPSACAAKLAAQSSGTAKRAPLLLQCLRAFGRQYVAIGILKLLNDGLNVLAGPILLNRLLLQLQGAQPSDAGSATDDSPPQLATPYPGAASLHETSDASCWPLPLAPAWCDAWVALRLPLALGAATLAKALLNSHYNYQLAVIAARLRAALVGRLYEKALATASGALPLLRRSLQRGSKFVAVVHAALIHCLS